MKPLQIIAHQLVVGFNPHQPLLTHFDLALHEGDFVAITGPNGGGKTTLIRTLLGLLPPLSGRVERVQEGLKIGYVPQVSSVDRHFPITVEEVVAQGIKGKADKSTLQPLLQKVGMQEHAHNPVGTLSGGQLQRTFIARALASTPSILFLDEPSTYLDKGFEAELIHILEELNAKQTTVVVVSHHIDSIFHLTNKVIRVNYDNTL